MNSCVDGGQVCAMMVGALGPERKAWCPWQGSGKGSTRLSLREEDHVERTRATASSGGPSCGHEDARRVGKE